MSSTVLFNNRHYLSSREAGQLSGYTSDYISRLCRMGEIIGQKIGHTWYVDRESFFNYITETNEEKEIRRQKLSDERKRHYEDCKLNYLQTVLVEAEDALHEENTVESIPLTYESAFPINILVVGLTSLVVCIMSLSLMLFADPTSPIVGLYEKQTASLGNAIGSLLSSTISFIQNTFARIKDSIFLAFMYPKEQDFSFGADTTAPLSQHATDPPGYGTSTTEGNGQAQGMVVVPSTGNNKKDDQVIEHIRNSFSDEVMVSPKDNGSGVIQPVFKTPSSDEYLYVLVPVKEQSESP